MSSERNIWTRKKKKEKKDRRMKKGGIRVSKDELLRSMYAWNS